MRLPRRTAVSKLAASRASSCCARTSSRGVISVLLDDDACVENLRIDAQIAPQRPRNSRGLWSLFPRGTGTRQSYPDFAEPGWLRFDTD